ncbi:hypothetical protein [Polynucleobacter hallstattensis]|uniref:hypothetical protein n=1 Tax=Polynucleobacter hallstattensis TaxID=1855586 RepID=UPI001C0C14DF|nr:hypothetical protein [Polynucleobacter hallstattensis]MBU3560421.1 hypothetical protein [Polynucleobacter hallstattensis]
MNQFQAKSDLSAVSSTFIKLEIDDLVRDRLLWQEQIARSFNPTEILPNVIHPLQANILKIL